MPTLTDYVAAIRHRLLNLAAVAIVLAVLVGLLAAARNAGSAMYEASADVLIHTEAEDDTLTLPTQARIAASLLVAERVEARLNSDLDAETLLENTVVTEIPESQILTIAAQADDAPTAARIANLFAEELLAVAAEETRAAMRLRVESLREQISFTQRRLDSALRNNQSSRAHRDLLFANLEELRAEENSLEQELEGETTAGRVIRPATPAETPVTGQMGPGLLATAAGVAGFLLALVFVLLQEHFSNRVRRRSDAAALLGTPVLALLETPLERHDDDIRRLANDLHQVMSRSEIGALLVTHVSVGSATQELVSRIAAHLRQADRKVAVVESKEEAAPDDGSRAVRRFPTPLTPPAAEKLVIELKSEWDTVLIHGPDARSADAVSLAASVDGIVLVAGGRELSQSQLSNTREYLRRTGTPAVGMVLISLPGQIPVREE